MKTIFIYLLLYFLLFSCNTKENIEPKNLEAINSASVAFKYSGFELKNFFKEPSKAFISGYFYFDANLANDIIFGLDIEWLEGVKNPIHFKGADWMSLAGFTRKGVLWFPIGSPQNLEGEPTSTDLWKHKDIGTELLPNTWYKMTIEAQFNLRKFSSVRLEGENLDVLIDISDYPLEYPNYIPLDKPSLTFYTFALRSNEFAQDNNGSTRVYFDDIEGGIITHSDKQILFSNGFEQQNEIEKIPITLPITKLNNIKENYWYLENDNAKTKIVTIIKRTGNKAIECNANLKND